MGGSYGSGYSKDLVVTGFFAYVILSGYRSVDRLIGYL